MIRTIYRPNGEVDMELLTGTITIPANPGAYTINTKPGSGKTTCIKQLIKDRWQEGVIYCVDTLASLNEVWRFIQEDLVLPGLINSDDVVRISSEDDEGLRIYLDQPWTLLDKPIILTTHVRFFTSLIDCLLLYKTTLPEGYFFDGDFSKLMSCPNLRKWICFDETPLFLKDYCEIPYSCFGLFSETGMDGQIHCKTLDEIHRYYETFLKDTPHDPFRHNHVSDEIKRYVVLNTIPKVYDSVVRRTDKRPYKIQYKPVDLVQPGMKSHVLVFEGVADVLLKDSPFEMLGTNRTPYNSNISFHEFPFSQIRKTPDTTAEAETIQHLIEIINHNKMSGIKKTLVVVWKNIGEVFGSEKEEAGKSKYVESIDAILKQEVGDGYAITYYGSPLTKSVNYFRDYGSIVLCGKWTLPKDETTRLNEWWNTDTTREDHRLWYFVQLLSRTAIRKHNGSSCSVYFSSDYSPTFIQRLQEYLLGIDKSGRRVIPEDWKEVVDGSGLHWRAKDVIVSVAKRIPILQTHILNAHTSPHPITVKIPKETLKDILSCSQTNRSIDRLKKGLFLLRINLEIES